MLKSNIIMNMIFKSNKGFAILGLIAGVAILLLFAFMLFGTSISCAVQQNTLAQNNKGLIESFKNTRILSSQPDPKAKISKDGDCVDSRPYLTLLKDFRTDVGGSEVLKDIDSTMTSQGYTKNNQGLVKTDCGVAGELNYLKDRSSIRVHLAEFEDNGATCVSNGPIDQATFGTHRIKVIQAVQLIRS
jgi:hypothetical protein